MANRANSLLALLVAALLWLVPSHPAMASSDAAAVSTETGQQRSRALQLIMFEDESCVWCERFKEEILPYYHKTEEGRRAPLRMVDIHDERPADLKHIRGVVYTPTFVLVDARGHELGRIEGYPGEEFFWFRLQQLLERAASHPAHAETSGGG